MDSSPPGSAISGILQENGVGCHFLLQELPIGFWKCRLLWSIPRNSDSVGLDLAQEPVLKVESPHW